MPSKRVTVAGVVTLPPSVVDMRPKETPPEGPQEGVAAAAPAPAVGRRPVLVTPTALALAAPSAVAQDATARLAVGVRPPSLAAPTKRLPEAVHVATVTGVTLAPVLGLERRPHRPSLVPVGPPALAPRVAPGGAVAVVVMVTMTRPATAGPAATSLRPMLKPPTPTLPSRVGG